MAAWLHELLCCTALLLQYLNIWNQIKFQIRIDILLNLFDIIKPDLNWIDIFKQGFDIKCNWCKPSAINHLKPLICYTVISCNSRCKLILRVKVYNFTNTNEYKWLNIFVGIILLFMSLLIYICQLF